LIAHNPIAGACFFDFMVKMFIKHVLGVGEKHPGIYGTLLGTHLKICLIFQISAGSHPLMGNLQVKSRY
jgi:hypothetical protein